MRNRINQMLEILRQYCRSPYFGFVHGHTHLHQEELLQLKNLVCQSTIGIVADFESEFAKLIGKGEAISYATGRMGFFDLMRILGIGKNDEVILLGSTCSVMVNAVLRTGATPVFSDIDLDTFGSAAKSIEACVTERTRMIVAQHSFGIPCDIKTIVELARSREIFLLEDCALTLGSKVDGIVVGNFGDAALFSTDHSKPLNTLTGGLIYTRNAELASHLRHSQSSCLDLPKVIQKALWQRLLLERRYCTPERYGRMSMIDLFASIRKKLFRTQNPFLSDEYGVKLRSGYPYPAKLPTFLAALGIIEVRRWSMVALERKALLRRLLEVACNNPTNSWLPKAYKNKHSDIVPLRLAWFQPGGANIRKLMRHFVDVSWTWFMQPIIATNEPLENFGYYSGTCSLSERIGPDMVNVPCNVHTNKSEELIKLFQETFNKREGKMNNNTSYKACARIQKDSKPTFDKKRFITHSKYWKFIDAPKATKTKIEIVYSLIRFLKLAVEKFFHLKIYRTNAEIDKAFVSYLSDPLILEYRLHLISKKLKDFFNELSINCDEETLCQIIKQYDVIFRNSNFLNLDGGMGYNNGLILFCFSKLAQVSTVIESGVWKGFTTYLLDSSIKKEAKIYCFDINLGTIKWKSNKAEYFEDDIQNVKLEILGETTLAFFDDHVSQYDRLLFAREHNIRYLVFDDDVSYLNLHSDGWPPIPTISMLWNNEKLPKKFEWISNSRTGIVDFTLCDVDFKNDYFYATAPELFELTGYKNSSRTSYLILK